MITRDEIDEIMYDKDLMDKLSANVLRKRKDGFGVTASEYARANEMNNGTALDILRELVEKGELKVEEMRIRGGKGMVFYE